MARGNPNGGSIIDCLGDHFNLCIPNYISLFVSGGMLMTNVGLSYNGSSHEAREDGSGVLHVDDDLFVCFVEKGCVLGIFGFESPKQKLKFGIVQLVPQGSVGLKMTCNFDD